MRKASCPKYDFLKENSCSSMNSMLWADFRSHHPNQPRFWNHQLSTEVALFSGNELIWHWFVRVTSEGCMPVVCSHAWVALLHFGIIMFKGQRESIGEEHSSFLCCWWPTGQTAGDLGSPAILRWDWVIYSAFLMLGYRIISTVLKLRVIKLWKSRTSLPSSEPVRKSSDWQESVRSRHWVEPCRFHTS